MSLRVTILVIIALSIATYMTLKSEDIPKESSITKNYKYRGQVLQDQFVLSVLKHKNSGIVDRRYRHIDMSKQPFSKSMLNLKLN